MRLLNTEYFIIISLLLLTAGCTTEEPVNKESDLQKEAVQVAQGFSVAWQNEDYSKVYDCFVPPLQSLRTKEEFVKFVTADQKLHRFNFIYDKVVLQDANTSYAYYTFSGELLAQPKTPAVEMKYLNGSWKLNTLASYFTNNCAVNDCSGYPQDNEIASLKKKCSLTVDTNYWTDERCQALAKRVYSGVVYTCDQTSGYVCSVSNRKMLEKNMNDIMESTLTDRELYEQALASNKRYECSSDNDCSRYQTCDTSILACVELKCSANKECSGKGVCDINTKICVECLSDSDCPVSSEFLWQQKKTKCRISDTASFNQCVQCRTDSDCSSGEFCEAIEGGTCVS